MARSIYWAGRAAMMVMLLLAMAGSVAAQEAAPFPGGVRVGDAWVPCDHPIALAAGKGCSASPAPAPPTVSCPARFDPYHTTVAQILACTDTAPKPTNPWTGEPFVFEVGQIYRWVYDTSDRIFVLGVALDPSNGQKLVTARRLKNGGLWGDAVTFHEPRTAWVPLAPGEGR